MANSDKIILITGANGFVGQHIIQFLTSKGIPLHATSRKTQPTQINVTWHCVDLLDKSQTYQLLKAVKPTHIIHLAWEVTHGLFWHSENNLDWLASSLHLLRSFKENGGQRFIGVGTCVEYAPTSEPCTEDDTPLKPTFLYARAKNAFYEVANEFCNQNNIELTWARLFQVVGAGEPSERLLPSIINSLINNQKINIMNAQNIRDFVDVRDVARAFSALLNTPITGPVNIAGGKGVKLSDICQQTSKMLTKENLIYFDTQSQNNEIYEILYANTNKLFNEIGFKPLYSFEDTVKDIERYMKI